MYTVQHSRTVTTRTRILEGATNHTAAFCKHPIRMPLFKKCRILIGFAFQSPSPGYDQRYRLFSVSSIIHLLRSISSACLIFRVHGDLKMPEVELVPNAPDVPFSTMMDDQCLGLQLICLSTKTGDNI